MKRNVIISIKQSPILVKFTLKDEVKCLIISLSL